jgi:hypothetical protein
MDRKYNIAGKGANTSTKFEGVLTFNPREWPERPTATLKTRVPLDDSSFVLVSDTKRTQRRWSVQLSGGKKCHNNHEHLVLVGAYTKTSK